MINQKQRRSVARRTMFIKLITASLANRRSRMAVILAAITIGAAVVSGVVSIYRDIGTQVGRELRGYGANLVALPGPAEKFIDPRATDKAAKSLGDKVVGYSPYLYGRVSLGRSEIVLAGVRLKQLKKISPYLKISGNSGENRVLVGKRLAERLDLAEEKNITLSFAARQKTFTIGGLVESGGVEEDQVFVDLKSAQELLRQPGAASLAYFSVLDRGSGLSVLAAKIGKRSAIRLQPITRIASNESRVLDTVRALIFSVAGVILITSVLAVATTMMAVVIERRREVGLKKALGAEDRSILIEFAGEGLVLGLIGGLLGWFAGYLVAQWIGQKVFHAFVSFSPVTLLIAVGASLAVATAAMLAPVRMALEVEPAIVLKGE